VLVVDTAANTIINGGTMAATVSNTLFIGSKVSNTGTLVANGGLIDCAGSVTGGISGGGILDFGAASTATTTFATRLAAPRHEGTTDLTNGLAVVSAVPSI
jgi:hypothetical protein